MPPRILVATLLLCALPAAVHAASLGELKGMLKDIDRLLGEIADDPVDAEGVAGAIAEGASDELLPPSRQHVSSSSAGQSVREERLQSVLSVDIGGQTLVLRDVPRDAWFMPFVRAVVHGGVMTGYRDDTGGLKGEFGPGNAVTLEEIAKIAVTATGDAGCGTDPRNDTARDRWSASFVGCAEARMWGVFADGTADVLRPATRAEVVFTLLQAFNVAAVPDLVLGTGFRDVPASSLFAGAIARAKQDGIVSGFTDAAGNPTGDFGPDQSVTRAETAKIVSLAMQVYGK
ncbi:MAG: Uncharacterized protein G01um101425_937 [Candidatus Peregrinibacteria bacterium Gr01-1014_25]|nr:MAG: Uncharacterized protein G01um101425_937 [Candidatus Peregrinibacteria bacterium Gr01-1014_25]